MKFEMKENKINTMLDEYLKLYNVYSHSTFIINYTKKLLRYRQFQLSNKTNIKTTLANPILKRHIRIKSKINTKI